MSENKSVGGETHIRASRLPHHFGELLHKLLFYTHQGLTRFDFLRQACGILMEFSGCDVLEVRISENARSHRCRSWIDSDGSLRWDFFSPADPTNKSVPAGKGPVLEPILEAVLSGDLTVAAPFLTRSGSFWTGDAARPILLRGKGAKAQGSRTVLIGGEFQSVAWIPFPVDDHTKGVLYLGSRRRDFFTRNDVRFYEAVAETLGVALAHQRAQWALRERVKELTCLYGVSNAVQNLNRPVDELLREVAELLPPGWQYPEITSARITFDRRSFATSGFQDYPWKQSADIAVNGVRRGRIEVVYSTEMPAIDEGPFLKEERNLIDAVAETLGLTLAHQRAQWALRERVKELTCLYGVAKATQNPARPVDDLLRDIVELLPPGWQYPEITSARITLDGRSFTTSGFGECPWKQSADILVNGVCRGSIDVVYSTEMPAIDEGPFLREERNLIDAVAETLGIALAYRAAQWALRERLKELTCLHAIAALAQQPDLSQTQLLQQIAGLLPPALQYPQRAQARIIMDQQPFATPGFQETEVSLTADIVFGGVRRGIVEVAYGGTLPHRDENPFLKEERDLIKEVARQVGLIIERREAEEEKTKLQEQLRHADRLATIGQLAAGAAHELNEPLGSVLGFAQLAKNCPKLPAQAEQDIEKIINAALHAREIIKKLMISARQMPTRKGPCNVNNLVREGLYFLESRCEREGISLVRQLEDGIPEITADASQLHQVLVNLVVNAIQAMPQGGTLTIQTRAEGDHILLVVEDTGTGMTEEVMKQLFIPFFTTKAIGQGTGLGLSVAHGIVTSHGGTIRVKSQVGKGSCFLVVLPVGKDSDSKENT
jgi:signal transduction histidine kinase